MKKYAVIDKQGEDFMEDTHEEPMTAHQLRSRFWSLEEGRTERFCDFTLDHISETWEVEFRKVRG